jgi:hypothetical protein
VVTLFAHVIIATSLFWENASGISVARECFGFFAPAPKQKPLNPETSRVNFGGPIM